MTGPADPDPGRIPPRERFARSAEVVAPDVLGLLLVRRDEDTVVRIVETEAYTQDDPACHGFTGRTARNDVLFGPPGHAYVYFTYGMHWCANVVTGADGEAGGVLLRAAEVRRGRDAIRARRGDKHVERDLLRGPARLAQGLGLSRADDGRDLLEPGGLLGLVDDGWRPTEIGRGPRVGVRQAADRPWRFWVAGSQLVSRYTRHPRAAPH